VYTAEAVVRIAKQRDIEMPIAESVHAILNGDVTVDDAIAKNVKVGDVIVRIDRKYFRPAEVESLLGDAAKAREDLGWEPEISVSQLCAEMMDFDILKAKQQALLLKHGYEVSNANGHE
ncbi:MAG: GDP-mannose 4,6-dehydratase, partial [Pseudomonadales bacterium]